MQQVSPTESPKMLMKENILFFITLRHAIFTYVLNIDFIYSVRKFLTGFVNAALMAWLLIVINAIRIAMIAAITNTHH